MTRPKRWGRVCTILVCTLVVPLVTTAPPAAAADVVATSERVILLSELTPPSPDPSGIAWDANANRMLISDSEVEEMTIFQDANLFELDLQGNLTRTGNFTGFSNEPTGLSIDPVSGHLFVSDDIKDKIFRVNPGIDGGFGTGDDSVTSFRTTDFGSTDPEDVAYDTNSGHLLVADGLGREVYDVSPGGNGQFDGVPPTGDDSVTHFDTAQYGSMGSEGLAFDPTRDTILVVDPKTQEIFETTTDGTLLNTIDLSVANPRHAEDAVLAPSLANPGVMNLYVVARGVDNDGNPNENDGKAHELSVTLPPLGNQAPVADAGPDLSVAMPNAVTLAGSISDDGFPVGAAVTSMWSPLPGAPGEALFTDPTSPTTDVSFTAAGTYVLRLTADDTELQGTDDVTVTVNPEGAVTLDIPIQSGSDDAEEAMSGSVNRSSKRLELATEVQSQTVGMRFKSVPIPSGATILSSYVQFEADSKDTSTVALVVEGQAAVAPQTFKTIAFNISSRQRTTEQVAWSPPSWNVLQERGPDQRTPDLSLVLDEIIDLPGWNGSAIVLIIRGDGVGRRTAESYNSGAAHAATLHVEYLP